MTCLSKFCQYHIHCLGRKDEYWRSDGRVRRKAEKRVRFSCILRYVLGYPEIAVERLRYFQVRPAWYTLGINLGATLLKGK
jgi:hypothetical protein